MADENGTNARLTRLEGDVREIFGRVATNEKALAALPYIEADMKEVEANTKATREWVEVQMRHAKEEEQRKETLSKAQVAAIIGAVGVVLASLLGAIASLVSSGVL